MTPEDAEEYTQALGQVVAGGWRQAALGERLGVPQALGMSTSEWVRERLGGYLKMSITERREAVAELTEEGMTQRDVAAVLGVDPMTVNRDLAATKPPSPPAPAVANATDEVVQPPSPPAPAVANATGVQPTQPPDFPSNTETVCPTCHGTGRVLLHERNHHA